MTLCGPEQVALKLVRRVALIPPILRCWLIRFHHHSGATTARLAPRSIRQRCLSTPPRPRKNPAALPNQLLQPLVGVEAASPTAHQKTVASACVREQTVLASIVSIAALDEPTPAFQAALGAASAPSAPSQALAEVNAFMPWCINDSAVE